MTITRHGVHTHHGNLIQQLSESPPTLLALVDGGEPPTEVGGVRVGRVVGGVRVGRMVGGVRVGRVVGGVRVGRVVGGVRVGRVVGGVRVGRVVGGVRVGRMVGGVRVGGREGAWGEVTITIDILTQQSDLLHTLGAEELSVLRQVSCRATMVINGGFGKN